MDKDGKQAGQTDPAIVALRLLSSLSEKDMLSFVARYNLYNAQHGIKTRLELRQSR